MPRAWFITRPPTTYDVRGRLPRGTWGGSTTPPAGSQLGVREGVRPAVRGVRRRKPLSRAAVGDGRGIWYEGDNGIWDMADRVQEQAAPTH